jgi:phage tail sheath protein FI
MGEACGPAEASYQLPEGTFRELIAKDRMTKFLKKRLTTLRKLEQLLELRGLPEEKADEVRLQHADEQARVKAAADREVAAGTPILVPAWRVQVTRYAHRLASAPSWLTTPATATVRVFADDTCEPVSF